MVAIHDEPIDDLERQGEIAIAFEVTTVLELELRDAGLGGLVLAERPVDVPWVEVQLIWRRQLGPGRESAVGVSRKAR